MIEGSNRSYEELASADQELSFVELESLLKERKGISELSDDVMRTLGLRDVEGKYNNAAAILADKNSFPGIDIARFGKSSDEILERVDLRGESLLTQFAKAVEVFRRNYTLQRIQGVERVELELIPEEAFREALANAVAHRTWDTNSAVRLSLFADRIEIVSPGGLPAGLSSDEYLNGQLSLLRNPILANVLFRLGYIEMFGTGIARINNIYRNSFTKPSFLIRHALIQVTLPLISDLTAFNEREVRILQAMQEGVEYTRAQLEDAAGLSKHEALRTLSPLIEQGVIVKQGKASRVRYRLGG